MKLEAITAQTKSQGFVQHKVMENRFSSIYGNYLSDVANDVPVVL